MLSSPPQVSRFIFEFNVADKVYHLNHTYTWEGVNGVQYDPSKVSRTVPLGSVEEWVIVNQRLGRGEGEEGCLAPRNESANSSAAPDTSGNGPERTGGGGGRRRRKMSLRDLELGEAGKMDIAACRRAGPGKVTARGHPFHLHVNHFQVLRNGGVRSGGMGASFWGLAMWYCHSVGSTLAYSVVPIENAWLETRHYRPQTRLP